VAPLLTVYKRPYKFSYRPSIGDCIPPPQSDLLQGTLDLLILKSLALDELHGIRISRRIAQITNGTFEVKAGSLFPALHRMDEAGWLSSSWGESETQPARQVLSSDQDRQATAPYQGRAMGASLRRDGECLASDVGG
jgi:hypothetical protein